uniref:Secreted frizzled related protein 1 n=1 Tax=Pavo cristatus TaxID=9049 RepID=A0A8C9FU49_PAVCR
MGRVRGALRALLSLAAGLLVCGGASEYDYVSYQSDLGPYPGGRFYTKPHQCVAIPADLRLCHSVGYDKMVLPNLLDHETMAEVKHQASSWVPLLNKNCHMGTQVFLCSLFAPVCLDRPVYPCRWLCEAVRDSCEPVMQFFGFFWPEMLKCDQFPQDDVCIAMTAPNATEVSRPKGTTVCPPCDNEMKSEAIVEHLCASEFGKEAFLLLFLAGMALQYGEEKTLSALAPKHPASLPAVPGAAGWVHNAGRASLCAGSRALQGATAAQQPLCYPGKLGAALLWAWRYSWGAGRLPGLCRAVQLCVVWILNHWIPTTLVVDMGQQYSPIACGQPVLSWGQACL